MLTRAQLLGQIMENYKYSIAVSGTHGKTTTTAMLSYIMLEADVDPTISVGGIIDDIGGNIRVGSSDYFVTEACEYTNSFHAFKPYIMLMRIIWISSAALKRSQSHSTHLQQRLLKTEKSL